MSRRRTKDLAGSAVRIEQPVITGSVAEPVLSPDARAELSVKVEELLRGKAEGQTGDFFYSEPSNAFDTVNGRATYESLRNREEYYPKDAETKLFESQKERIEDIAPRSEIFISLGGGSNEAFSKKDLELLKASGASTVYLIDVSKEYLDEQEAAIREAIVKQDLPFDTRVVKIQEDFKTAVKRLADEGQLDYQVSMCMTGLTLFNMGLHEDVDHGNDYQTMINVVAALIKPLAQNSTFYITQDTNTDPDIVKKAYDDPILIDQWGQDFWGLVQRELYTESFDPSIFKSVLEYENSYKNRVALKSIATRDATFRIGNETYSVKEGDVFVNITSKKFGISSGKGGDIVKDIFDEAGARHDTTLNGPHGSALRVFRKGPAGPA